MVTHHEHIVFGIDLGTTYSCIAYVDKTGQPIIIPDEDNHHTVPSVVQFEGDKRVVGRDAKSSAVLNPRDVKPLIKRDMGHRVYRFPWNGENYPPEEISAYILRKLANQAQKRLGFPVKNVVITCPAYFGIAQRDATRIAGELAGLNVLTVINEPSAAAIAYGMLNQGNDQVVLVFDLGGGTFDVTVIKISEGTITVIATGGDHHLGGYDWDAEIVKYLVEQWREEKHSLDDPTESEETLQDTLNRVEEAKIRLTRLNETKIAFYHEGLRLSVTLTRKKFDELTEHLLLSAMNYTEMTIREAKKRGIEKIDQILLVGGAAKMPQIAERLEQLYQIKPQLYEPDEAVARGAAIYGQKLYLDEEIDKKIHLESLSVTGVPYDEIDISKLPTAKLTSIYQRVANDANMPWLVVQRWHRLQLTNVASHSFGVVVIEKETGHRYINNLVLANDRLPATRTKTYRAADNPEIELKIYENDKPFERVEGIEAGREIECIRLSLPPGVPNDARLEVTFHLNEQGLLHVTGRELVKGKQVEAEIKTEGSLSKQEIEEAKARMSHLIIL